MSKASLICAPALLACATAAQAAESKLALTTEHIDYSDAFGKRRETSVEYTTDLGRTAFTVSASRAKRKFEEESFTAVEVAGTVYQDWSDRLYTRTSVGVSSNKPVFASRQVANDFNLKLLSSAVVTVGGKYARYHSDRDALSWSAGGTWYFRDAFVTYRYSSHDVDRLGKSHSHLATFRLKDGNGHTQLWLGSGTSLHEQELLLSGRQGKYRSIALQRVQPLKGRVTLNLSLGRAWYDTTAANYHGTTASVGLNYSGWRLF